MRSSANSAGRNRALLVTHHMQPDVIFEDLCHQAVDSASDVGEQHQHVGAVASRGERAFDGIDLAADALNASYKFAAKRRMVKILRRHGGDSTSDALQAAPCSESEAAQGSFVCPARRGTARGCSFLDGSAPHGNVP